MLRFAAEHELGEKGAFLIKAAASAAEKLETSEF